MKVEFWIEGPKTAAAYASFLPAWFDAMRADRAESDARAIVEIDRTLTEAGITEEAKVEEKPKRTRKTAEAPKEPEPAIRATPEDRQPVVEEAVVVAEEPAPTVDDVRAALNDVVSKHGMAYATANVLRLLGAPKVGAVDPANYGEVLARLRAELDVVVEDING